VGKATVSLAQKGLVNGGEDRIFGEVSESKAEEEGILSTVSFLNRTFEALPAESYGISEDFDGLYFELTDLE
jgi:hypothetical protein